MNYYQFPQFTQPYYPQYTTPQYTQPQFAQPQDEQSYIENILRQMPFLNLMPMGDIKLKDVVSYLNAGACAVGVGRDFYQGFTPREITNRTKEILTEVRDFTEWKEK
jgi:2-keto-3-deoxy-6-phosphogluconate aldolase